MSERISAERIAEIEDILDMDLRLANPVVRELLAAYKNVQEDYARLYEQSTEAWSKLHEACATNTSFHRRLQAVEGKHLRKLNEAKAQWRYWKQRTKQMSERYLALLEKYNTANAKINELREELETAKADYKSAQEESEQLRAAIWNDDYMPESPLCNHEVTLSMIDDLRHAYSLLCQTETARADGYREGVEAARAVVAARHQETANDRVCVACLELLQQIDALLPATPTREEDGE